MRIEYDMTSEDCILIVNKYIGTENSLVLSRGKKILIYNIGFLLWATVIAYLSEYVLSAILFISFAFGLYMEHKRAVVSVGTIISERAKEHIGHHIMIIDDAGITMEYSDISVRVSWKHINGYSIDDDAIAIRYSNRKQMLLLLKKTSAENADELISILTQKNIPKVAYVPFSLSKGKK